MRAGLWGHELPRPCGQEECQITKKNSNFIILKTKTVIFLKARIPEVFLYLLAVIILKDILYLSCMFHII